MNSQPSRSILVARRLVCGTAIFLALGFLLHTSHERSVLGKYSVRYAAFLALLFAVILPCFWAVVRFLTSDSQFHGWRGKTYHIGPWQKIRASLWAGLVVFFVGKAAVGWLLAGHILTYDAHIFHPYLQNIPRPNDAEQHVNRWGFRGDDLEPTKPPDVFRIFVFGGSTVHCGTVDFEDTHCRILEKRLADEYPQYRIEVQNLGAEWHCTEHSINKLLFSAQDFSPDLAIIFHGINDLVRGFEPDFFSQGPYRRDYGHYLGAAANLVRPRSSWFVCNAGAGHWCSDLRFDRVWLAGPQGRGLHGMVELFYPKTVPIEITQWRSLPVFRRNLRDFITIARGKEIEVLLATQASLYRQDLTPEERERLGFPKSHQFGGKRASLASMTDGMRQFNDATRAIAADTQTRLVDLDRAMPKTTRYMYDDVHYTLAGNEMIGNAFANHIITWGIIPSVMSAREQSPSPRPSPPRRLTLR